ncbi:MAG: COX15/CtaA family protein [Ferruginibacter sp.]
MLLNFYSQILLTTFAAMNTLLQQKTNKQVATWLFIGVIMIVIQVLIGGITRLTESGLSITEWKPITGALPPLNEAAWQVEFDKYRTTNQFKYVHSNFAMSDFKFIFFWEWMHRLWARLLGVVFLIGFIYFLAAKKLRRNMLWPMVLLFFLGAIQGAIGWLMVKSGLVPEKFYVGHIELTTHFIAALILLAYTLWFALQLYYAGAEKVYSKKLSVLLITFCVLFFVQLIFGGFMAGLKAAQSAPTWPTINGSMFPAELNELQPWYKNVFQNQLTIHFIHRGLAYLLFFTGVYFCTSTSCLRHQMFRKLKNIFLALLGVQVLLGVLAVTNATNNKLFIYFGLMHQFVAMLLLINLVYLLFFVRAKNSITTNPSIL